MDEPFAAVDAQTRADLEDLIRDIWQRIGVTILFVTHDIDESVYLGRAGAHPVRRRRPSSRRTSPSTCRTSATSSTTRSMPRFAELRGARVRADPAREEGVRARRCPQDDGPSVREATFEVMRRQAMTTIFSNPGSTEVSFLADLPDDLRFVLALHEGIGRRHRHGPGDRQPPAGVRAAAHHGRPRQRRRGDRDRAGQPCAARDRGRPAGPPPPRARAVPRRRRWPASPGDYPLDVLQPARAAGRAVGDRAGPRHTARDGQGPVVVIVPMDDWDAPADADARAAATRVVRAPATRPTWPS